MVTTCGNLHLQQIRLTLSWVDLYLLQAMFQLLLLVQRRSHSAIFLITGSQIDNLVVSNALMSYMLQQVK